MNNRNLIFSIEKEINFGNKSFTEYFKSINVHTFSCSSAGSVVGAVVGGIVGMIFFITCIALLVCTLNQKKKKKKKQNQSQRNQVLSFGADSSNAFHTHGSKFSIKYFVWFYTQVWMSLTLQKKILHCLHYSNEAPKTSLNYLCLHLSFNQLNHS